MALNPIQELGEVIQSYNSGNFDPERAQRAINRAITTPGLKNCDETISIVRNLMSKRDNESQVTYKEARKAFEPLHDD